MNSYILWVQFLSSFWMTSIIWFVQIVHYPLFLYVPQKARSAYVKRHQYLIAWLVIPGMFIEVATLSILQFRNNYSNLLIVSIICLIIIWTSTFFVQLPFHRHLLTRPSDLIVRRLILTNWIRTFAWTVKAFCISFYLVKFCIRI